MIKQTSRLLLFALSLIPLPLTTLGAEMLSVKSDKVNMRSGPGLQHKIKWEYGPGFPLEILKKQGEWLQVKDFEDEVGWIHRSHLQKKRFLIVKSKDQDQTINIRSGPGASSAIVGNAFHGVVFSRLEEKADWVKVQHETGLTGWVNKGLLWGY